MPHIFSNIKIPYISDKQFLKELNNISGKIINIEITTPERTDTYRWYNIYYAYAL